MTTPEEARKRADWLEKNERLITTAEMMRDLANQVEALQADAERHFRAGRESMREEVTPIIFGQCDSDNVAQRTIEAIRKIEL